MEKYVTSQGYSRCGMIGPIHYVSLDKSHKSSIITGLAHYRIELMNKCSNTTTLYLVIQSNDDYVRKVTEDHIRIKNCKDRKLSCVGLHEQKFGKRDRIEHKSFHVWETNNWRIYVNNREGMSFEVPVDFTPEQAMNAWNEYVKIVLPYKQRS
jgi:hypothetical protein